jgi:hypothetical protein
MKLPTQGGREGDHADPPAVTPGAEADRFPPPAEAKGASAQPEGAPSPATRDETRDSDRLADTGRPSVNDRDAYAASALAERDRRVAELERLCKSAVRDRELATALAGRPLVAGAAPQLIKLWRDDFDVYEEGGGFRVVSRDGKPAVQAIDELLGSAEYSHFCLPSSRGGTGAREGSRPGGAVTPGSAPKNLGEAIVSRWREESATRPNHVAKPIGLRRHR